MAQYLALAASAVSLVVPGSQGKEGAASSSRNSSTMGMPSFSVGVVAGLTLGAYLASEVKRNRVKERMRATCSTWLKSMNTDESQSSTEDTEETTPLEPNLLDPISSKDIDGKSIGSSSLLQILVDPNNALTSNLHSARITLKSGTRTRPRESKGVELFYILQGVGYFSRDGNEAQKMVANDLVVVNPWTVRSMTNNGSADLIFLRICDSGNQCNEEGFDVVAAVESGGTQKAIRDAMSKIGSALSSTKKE